MDAADVSRVEFRLGVEGVAVDFRELRTGRERLDALRSAIASGLARLTADSVDEVLHTCLGSPIPVREEWQAIVRSRLTAIAAPNCARRRRPKRS